MGLYQGWFDFFFSFCMQKELGVTKSFKSETHLVITASPTIEIHI